MNRRTMASMLAAGVVATALAGCTTAPLPAEPVADSTLSPAIIRVPVPAPYKVTERVEVPVTVTETVVETETVNVPDPTAYDRGYADARAEYEISDDYLADWWEDGRDAGYQQALAETSELGGMVDPANIMAALDTPCQQEDSVNCYWRADIMGNGDGDSFVNIEGHIFPLDSVLTGGE